MRERNNQPCEFVPITDELLYNNPRLVTKLVPYRREYRCHRELADTAAVKINRARLGPDDRLQLPLLNSGPRD